MQLTSAVGQLRSFRHVRKASLERLIYEGQRSRVQGKLDESFAAPPSARQLSAFLKHCLYCAEMSEGKMEKMRSPSGVAWIFSSCILFAASPSTYACPDGQYQQCILGACACLPEVGGDVGSAAEHAKQEMNAQTQGPILAVWIRQSHDSAIGSSSPIPPNIRQQLTGYIEDDILNRARYKVGDNGILNLAGLTLQYGDKFAGHDSVAVTLDNLVVFRSAQDAQNNSALWAHELTHVQQFRDWGVDDFAKRYMRDFNTVETPAYAVQNNYPGWRASHPLINGAGPGMQQPTYSGSMGGGLPSGYGMQTCGCWGPTSGLAPEPRCMSGSVRVNQCAGMCPGGGSPYAWLCQ